MSNIDFSQAITAEAKAAAVLEARAAALKGECRRRITAIFDMPTQINMAAQGDAVDMPDIKRAQKWIRAMRMACRAAIAGEEPVWPEAPAGARELAARY